jgi:hypothetical protein
MLFPCLMGANIQLKQAAPNPNNQPLRLGLSCEWSLAQGEIWKFIHGIAKKDGVETPAVANVNQIQVPWTWSVNMQVPAAGTYECRGRLFYNLQNDPPGIVRFVNSNTMNATVQ